jgi:hypothetical protein
MIQFCRHIPLLGGGRIIVAAPAPLLRLLRTLPGDAEVVAAGPLPPADTFCSVMDLPALSGTTIETVPAAVPYLHSAPEAVAHWRDRLSTLEGRAVGLCWAGGARYQHDRRRSIAPEALAALGDVPGVRFVSLQKEANRTPDLDLVDWTNELDDFADAAALIEALDLVITVDTAVAHLAGALGRPVWLLNRFGGDWRWLLDRDDSPWYPTLRQFRQPALNDWASVIARVRLELSGSSIG